MKLNPGHARAVQRSALGWGNGQAAAQPAVRACAEYAGGLSGGLPGGLPGGPPWACQVSAPQHQAGTWAAPVCRSVVQDGALSQNQHYLYCPSMQYTIPYAHLHLTSTTCTHLQINAELSN